MQVSPRTSHKLIESASPGENLRGGILDKDPGGPY